MPSRLTAVLLSLLLATPVVLFWLWLVILSARVAIECPKECRCDTGGYAIFCSGASINPIPLIHLTDVRALWLSENNITLLKKDSFVSLTELKLMDIHSCGLRTIELGAFNGLTKLTELYFEGNELSEIKPGTFENMESLHYLGFFLNRLTHLDSGVFSGLTNLKSIDMRETLLQYLHPDTFLGLPNLQYVNIYDSPSLQTPTDRSFINSHSLSQLFITNSNISSLSVETFSNVSSLEKLDISYNNLRTLDKKILRALPELSELYLHGNPLECDCQLQEVWRWCKDRNIQTRGWKNVPECDAPSEVEGMWWGVLEKGQCLEGNIQYYGDYNCTIYIASDTVYNFNDQYDIKYLKNYQVTLYAFPFIFGTISNVILLIIIIFNKDMRTVPNMYIFNLAISDIIYLTVLFSEAYANRISDDWVDVEFMCMFLPFCRRMCIGLSAYSVAMFSFQRYRVTVNPFQVHVSSQATWCSTVATLFGVWIMAALFAVPSALSKHMCEGLLPSSRRTYYQRVVIFELLVSCVLPLCVIAFSYIMTACHLVESSRAISEGTQNPQLKTRRNSAKIVVGLTVVFLISYVPYHAFWTYINCAESGQVWAAKIADILRHLNYKFHYTYLISTCFLSINSCLNPVALICTSSPFKQHLKRYLTCFCKTNSPPTDLELARRN